MGRGEEGREKNKRGGEIGWSARGGKNRRRGRGKREGMGRSRGVVSGRYVGLTDTHFDLAGKQIGIWIEKLVGKFARINTKIKVVTRN